MGLVRGLSAITEARPPHPALRADLSPKGEVVGARQDCW